MKKLSVVMAVILISVVAFGAGLVDNGNQSAAYIRTMNRNASTGIDAVYYNPAGLTKLEDGLYLSFSNQSIWQEKKIENDFAALKEKVFYLIENEDKRTTFSRNAKDDFMNSISIDNMYEGFKNCVKMVSCKP